LAAALCCAAAKNYCCVAPWRAHQTLLSPATGTLYAVMPGPVRTAPASDVGSAGTGAVR
jgi:hypothetical protein